MADSPVVLSLWGKVLIQNKLIDQAKWDEALRAHSAAGGKLGIGQILLDKKLLSAKAVEAVGKKVTEVVAKRVPGAPAPAAAVAPAKAPAAVAVAAPPTKAPVAVAKAQAAPAADSGEIGLEDDGGKDANGWRPSDAEWVESSPNDKPKAATAAPDDLEEISIDGEEELTVPMDGPSKIIVDNRPTIKRVPPPTKGKPIAGVAKIGEAAAEEHEADRVESPVAPSDMDPDALKYLEHAVSLGASDLHLASGSPPFMRLHGTLTFIEGAEKLTPERAQRMVLGFMDDKQQQRYLRTHDLDFAYERPELGRFRVNALEQFRGPDIIFRIIPKKVPSLEELNLPAALAKFTDWHQGLVLVTGPAGCGKSTTAAALIDLVNSHRKDHVITVEDPVEFLHHSKGCNVTQRQVISHTLSFATALKAALREDPDVIMIGEMRDLETVSLAIRAAETGHLVIGTLQTKSAARTIDRVVDVFPADQQAQIRTMLSESLRGIISQQLIPRADGKGRIVSLEVLHVTTAVSNLIRDSKTFQLQSLMQTGRKIGQRLMDDSLEELFKAGTITREEAAKAAENPKRFRKEEPVAVDPKAKK